MPYGDERYFGDGSTLRAADSESLQLRADAHLAQESLRQTQTAEAEMQRLLSGERFVATPEQQRGLARQAPEQAQGAIAKLANRGMLHSGALAAAKRGIIQNQAIQSAQLQAQEQARRLALQANAAKLSSLSAEGMRKVPEEAFVQGTGGRKGGKWWDPLGMIKETAARTGPTGEVFKTEREAHAASQERIAGMQEKLLAVRPSREQLLREFNADIDETYDFYGRAMMASARRRGATAEDIKILQQNLYAEKAEAMDHATQFAEALSHPDPSMAAAALQAVYQPPRMNYIVQEQQNPMWGFLGGVAGAVAGGVATGGSPQGIMAGWGVGRGTVDMFGGGPGGAAIAGLGAAGAGYYFGGDEYKNY